MARQESLNEGNAVTWSGEERNIYAFAKVDHTADCFMGNADRFIPMGIRTAETIKM